MNWFVNSKKNVQSQKMVQKMIEQSIQRTLVSLWKILFSLTRGERELSWYERKSRRGGEKKKKRMPSYFRIRAISHVFNYNRVSLDFKIPGLPSPFTSCPNRSPISRSAAYVVSIFQVSVRLLFSRISDVPPFFRDSERASTSATSRVIRSPDTFEGARDLPRYQLLLLLLLLLLPCAFSPSRPYFLPTIRYQMANFKIENSPNTLPPTRSARRRYRSGQRNRRVKTVETNPMADFRVEFVSSVSTFGNESKEDTTLTAVFYFPSRLQVGIQRVVIGDICAIYVLVG